MDACLLYCVRFSFSVLSQVVGWEERLQNELFCVEWDINLNSNQSQHKVGADGTATLSTY